jgi:hypothetical protein
MLLIAGCTGPGAGAPQAGNQSPQEPGGSQPQAGVNGSGGAAGGQDGANASTAPSCDEYCRTLPHAECVGNWNISGTYPGCVCGFDCTVQGPEDGGNAGEPLATPTNMTVSQLMDAALKAQADEFYHVNSGTFSEKRYTWLREGTGGFLGGGASPASDVKFDGAEVAGIRAAGFTVFENKAGGRDRAWGVAVFNESRTALDNYTGSDTFGVTFFPSMIDKELVDCWIYSKDYNVDAQGGWLLSYLFKCEQAVDR